MGTSEHLFFDGAGGIQLAARLELPENETPIAYGIFAHCFTCSKDIKAAVTISRALAARGIAVLRYDAAGLGQSEGDFGSTTFSGSVKDVQAAIGFMESRAQSPTLLIGHSLGGAAVLAASVESPSIRAVATIGAPSDPAHALHLFANAVKTIEREGSAPVEIAGRTFQVDRAMLDDMRTASVVDAVRRTTAALMFMHAPEDTVVPIEHAAMLYAAARHPKSFLSLDNADHMLSRAVDAEYAASVMTAWAARYLL